MFRREAESSKQKPLRFQKPKGIRDKKRKDTNNHDCDKDDFDGTPASVNSAMSRSKSDVSDDKATSPGNDKSKEIRLYRQGLSYRTMTADNKVCHDSDVSKLPAGAVIIKRVRKYAYEQVSGLLEHDYEVIRYKALDGKLHDGYFPLNGHLEIMDVVPGTHAPCSLLAYLAFNKYVLDTPLYREMYRFLGEDMSLSCMTLTNWLEKGSAHIFELVNSLKKTCLEKDSVINCDETWCRVKREGCYKKKYIWCLVNKLSKVVIYCYEDGSRERRVETYIG